MEIKGVVGVNPWKEYNENVERCRTVLLCGARIRGEWIHLSKIIARKMYWPLERSRCSTFLVGKKCQIYKDSKLNLGWDGIITCSNSFGTMFHLVCKNCFRPGIHFSPEVYFPSDYLCEKCKIK